MKSSYSVQTQISCFWKKKLSHQWITHHCTPTSYFALWPSHFESLHLKNLWTLESLAFLVFSISAFPQFFNKLKQLRQLSLFDTEWLQKCPYIVIKMQRITTCKSLKLWFWFGLSVCEKKILPSAHWMFNFVHLSFGDRLWFVHMWLIWACCWHFYMNHYLEGVMCTCMLWDQQNKSMVSVAESNSELHSGLFILSELSSTFIFCSHLFDVDMAWNVQCLTPAGRMLVLLWCSAIADR